MKQLLMCIALIMSVSLVSPANPIFEPKPKPKVEKRVVTYYVIIDYPYSNGMGGPRCYSVTYTINSGIVIGYTVTYTLQPKSACDPYTTPVHTPINMRQEVGPLTDAEEFDCIKSAINENEGGTVVFQ